MVRSESLRVVLSNPIDLHLYRLLRALTINGAFRPLFQVEGHRAARDGLRIPDNSPGAAVEDINNLLRRPHNPPGVPPLHVHVTLLSLQDVVRVTPVNRGGSPMD